MPSPLKEKVCELCGRTWVTRSLRARTCSKKCSAILREREHPSPGASQREYSPELVERIQQMYINGSTIREIGTAIGPGVKVQRIVERFIAERRQPGPRDQSGERNPQWKGSGASYGAFHFRVEAARGKPSQCVCCDDADPDGRYEWANLTGRYDDIFDYIRLCVTCHRRFDARRRSALGHRTSPVRGGGVHV
jgi:hypothetical protein